MRTSVTAAKLDGCLTLRELEVLALIAQGQSAKEAAIACSIAPRTVESHLDAIRLKLNARNRVHMVAIAITSEILSFPLLEPVGTPTGHHRPMLGELAVN